MTTSTLFFHYEFEILDEHDQTVASGDASTLEEAESEGRHYLAQYEQDGPCTLELRQVKVLEVSSPSPIPDRPPLWRLMAEVELDVLMAHPDFLSDAGKAAALAAEILAVRDHLFPGGRPDPVGVSPDCLAIWDELTAEAERAEQGDG